MISSRYEILNNDNYLNGYYTYDKDIRGSTTSIIDSSGTIKNGYVYDEYGKIEEITETILNEETYTGAVFDSESGLYYLNARYYNSETGQFISRDTYKGSPYTSWTHNLYSYTGNNPINYVDPSGHIMVGALDRNQEAMPGGGGALATLGVIYVVWTVAKFVGNILTQTIEFGTQSLAYAKTRIEQWIKQQTNEIGEIEARDQSVYVLVNKQNEVKYIGRTDNPARRESEHKYDKKHPERYDYKLKVIQSGLGKVRCILSKQ